MPDSTPNDILHLYARRALENVAGVERHVDLTDDEQEAFAVVGQVCAAIVNGNRT